MREIGPSYIPDLPSAHHLRSWVERRQAVDKAGHTRDFLARHGIDCPDITGVGTGSFEFEAASGLYTELQCGSYIFMDADYGRNRDRDGGPTKEFEPSLFVWGAVMSRPGTAQSWTPASRRSPSTQARHWSATSPPRPASAPPTSTAVSPSRPPPTACGSATRSA